MNKYRSPMTKDHGIHIEVKNNAAPIGTRLGDTKEIFISFDARTSLHE